MLAVTEFGFTGNDFRLGLPLLLLTLGVLGIMAVAAFSKTERRQRQSGFLASGILLVSFFIVLIQLGKMVGLHDPLPGRQGFTESIFNGVFFVTSPHLIGHLLLIGAAFLTTLLSFPFLKPGEDRPFYCEYFMLLLLMPLGGMLMISGANLMVCFLGLEILSLSLYILVAIRSNRPAGVEAGIKYFLLGAFAAAFFVFGLAMLYAGKGDVTLPSFFIQWEQQPKLFGFAGLGATMIFAALLFKASLFPFQMWTPDVYQGAPTPVTALMATGTKAAAFILILAVAGLVPKEIRLAVPTLAILTMVAGNFGAIRQLDIKRLLAYSSIAHAGYLMVGVNSVMSATSWPEASSPVRFVYFYLAVYTFSNFGALAVIAYLERGDENAVTLTGLQGLCRRHPWAAAMLTLFLVSLGGIPPTAGFWGKFLIFSQAIRFQFYILAGLGLLLSAVSLYYYLKVVVSMYLKPAKTKAPMTTPSPLMAVVIGICAFGVILFGLLNPSLILNYLQSLNL